MLSEGKSIPLCQISVSGLSRDLDVSPAFLGAVHFGRGGEMIPVVMIFLAY